MADKTGKDKGKPGDASDLERYNGLKAKLISEIVRKQELSSALEDLEDSIYNKENDYFGESVYGNIVKGFDNFNKSNTGGSNKRKLTYSDEDHIFSMSSVNYVKNVMRKQGLASNGSKNEDFEDYEDSVEPGSATPTNGSNPQPMSNQVALGRKRKSRTVEE